MQPSIKSFANDLQRVLQLSQLLRLSIEYMNLNDETPAAFAAAGQGINKQIDRFFWQCEKSSPAAWASIKADLEGDNMQDRLLLIDAVANVENIGEAVAAINESKEAVR